MAKRIATMLLNKNNSQSCPPNAAMGLAQKERSSSTTDVPDSPFISTNFESGMRNSSSSCYLRARDVEIKKTLSLRSLTSMVSLKKESGPPGKSSRSRTKPGEPVLVSARPRTSPSSSLNGICYSIDTKEMMMGHSEVIQFSSTVQEESSVHQSFLIRQCHN